jgi:hypothetical protein
LTDPDKIIIFCIYTSLHIYKSVYFSQIEQGGGEIE